MNEDIVIKFWELMGNAMFDEVGEFYVKYNSKSVTH